MVFWVRTSLQSIIFCSSSDIVTSESISESSCGVAFMKSSLKGATNTPAMSAAPGLIDRCSSGEAE